MKQNLTKKFQALGLVTVVALSSTTVAVTTRPLNVEAAST